MIARAHPRMPLVAWRRVWRAALLSLAALIATVLLLFIAVNRVPWLGPSLADGLRRIIGTDAVTRLEEWAYGLQDRWNRLWRSGEKPQAYWSVPSGSAPEAAPRFTSEAQDAAPAVPRFRPRDVGPVDARVAAAGDGVWVPVPDARHLDAQPILYKTLLHPDQQRPWSVAFVVAIDASRVDLRLMAGSEDPEATAAEARSAERPARVPDDEQPRLLAAFNGGFKTEHGHYGMRVGGTTLIPPRPDVCSIAAYQDGSLRIATWKDIADTVSNMTWWRQTPPCMVEHGKLHPGLNADATTNWGAALGGETAIRRSAIGLDSAHSTLLVTVTEYTTARAIALALLHAGADFVAELDVNWSYPKFVVYRTKDERLVADGLFPGFVFDEDEYVRGRALKDFFYLLRR